MRQDKSYFERKIDIEYEYETSTKTYSKKQGIVSMVIALILYHFHLEILNK